MGRHVGHLAHDVLPVKLVAQRAGELSADVSLAHGVAIGKRHRRHLGVLVLRRHFERLVDDADLRAVAVSHHNVDALFHHAGEILRCALQQLQLLARRIPQSIAAEGHHHALAVQFALQHVRNSFLRFRSTVAKARQKTLCERQAGTGPLPIAPMGGTPPRDRLGRRLDRRRSSTRTTREDAGRAEAARPWRVSDPQPVVA